MVACSGDDTGIEVILEPEIEVIPEPEPMEEVIPEPELEPVVETIYVPTLESWGIEDGLLEIVDGNCNLPIFRKTPFPYVHTMEEIPGQLGSAGGPECRDDDKEGSLIKVACVDETNLGGYFVYCVDGHPDYVNDPVLSEIDVPQLCVDKAEEQDGTCVLTYYDPNNPRPLPIIHSGYTNFYTNLFKKSGFYENKKGEPRLSNARSFIMVRTHRSLSGYQIADAVGGKLYGKYNPDSAEYKDRKRLWDACEVGTDPQIGSGKEDDWRENGINGEWQARKRDDGLEICIRLNTLPGSVKCFVDSDGMYNLSNLPSKQLCEFFDEG